MTTDEELGLERFVLAQDAGGTYLRALEEIRRGAKRSHWMWFVFPQLKGLGSSEMARRYALAGLAEAKAYLDHPVLGARLEECAAALLGLTGRGAGQVFGDIDAKKLRSSMTLFKMAAGPGSPYSRVLDRYFDGEEDPRTVEALTGGG